MDSGCTNHMTGDKDLFTEDKLTESSQRYITFGDNNKEKYLVWVRLLYRRISILIRLCLFNHLDIILCLSQNFVIWVCLYCFLLLVVLSFHRMIIPSCSKDIAKVICISLIFLRDLQFPHV